MRSTFLPNASTFHTTDRRTRSRIDLSGLLPWGELFIAGLLMVGFSVFG
jgi:hypothetical protein